MAKRGTLEHPKTLALADKLGIMDPWALGLLEAFWNWVARYHPDGDVSGTKPSMLARSIRYTGDAEELWAALQDCNSPASSFIDKLEDDRMLVHGWSEHADDAVRKRLLRQGDNFADGSEPYARKQGQRRDKRATKV